MEIVEEYLSIKEFANLLKLHPNTVRRAIYAGKLQALRIGPGDRAVYRIPKSEIGRIALFDLREMVEKIINDKKDK